MEYEILYGPAYALGRIRLNPGETIQAEAGAMVSMSSTVDIKTEARGGLLGGLKRSVLGGESFFLNTFSAQAAGAELTIAPALPGDIIPIEMDGTKQMFVQSGSFLASTAGISYDTKFGGGKTFFSREGLFLLKAQGSGTMWVSSYGAIHIIDLGAGETYRIDTGHMVAFEEGMGYDVARIAGWKSTLLSGEGLVVNLSGPGRFYMQTRSPESFIAWLAPKLPGRRE
jgi:uncharacterized protein (TIGR00266 family)